MHKVWMIETKNDEGAWVREHRSPYQYERTAVQEVARRVKSLQARSLNRMQDLKSTKRGHGKVEWETLRGTVLEAPDRFRVVGVNLQ